MVGDLAPVGGFVVHRSYAAVGVMPGPKRFPDRDEIASVRAEAESHAGHGRRSDQAGDGHAETLDDQHGRDAVDQDQRRPRDHLGQGVPVLGGLRTDEGISILLPGIDAGRDPGLHMRHGAGGRR